jgi:hypothetical protein
VGSLDLLGLKVKTSFLKRNFEDRIEQNYPGKECRYEQFCLKFPGGKVIRTYLRNILPVKCSRFVWTQGSVQLLDWNICSVLSCR